MLNSEDNMKNLKDTETKVTVGNRKNLTGTKCGDWHGWQKFNRKIHHATLTNTAIITGLHENPFIVTRSLQKVFQLMLEDETRILNFFKPEFVLARKWQTNT